jgi:putative intracellular protease/amidase
MMNSSINLEPISFLIIGLFISAFFTTGIATANDCMVSGVDDSKSSVTILMPLPSTDFDPTESAVTWKILKTKGHNMIFATPDGAPGRADPIMVTGKGLSIWKWFLRADSNGRLAYEEILKDENYNNPLRWDEINIDDFDAIVLPGGHAKGMIEYLESETLQMLVGVFFEEGKLVGAICHGVVLAARSENPSTGKSVLYGKQVTTLPEKMELFVWRMTKLWMGDYYRTYPITVEDEVKSVLESPDDFDGGPFSILRDSMDHLERGFVVRDGLLVTARWPGDTHHFAVEFDKLLQETLE